MKFKEPKFYKGGGGGTPPLPAPPAPPASATAIEVTQAKTDAKRQAKSRGGISSTILAGANDSLGSNATGGKNTLLGGA